VCTHKRKWGFRLRVPKRVLFFFLSPMQRGLLATYPAPISTVFELKDVNQCLHAYTGEKFPNFCIGGFPRRKTTKNMVL